ncbi:MAG: hypothetical protein WC884_04130 [Candidatus Paceibacterota bacterium]
MIEKEKNKVSIWIPFILIVLFVLLIGWLNSDEKTETSTVPISNTSNQNTVVETQVPEKKQVSKEVHKEIILPKSESVLPVTPTPTYNRIDGLSAIRIGGGIVWGNWDSDPEKDGPIIDIVYLDSQGEIITSDATREMSISADVKAYAKNKGELKLSSSASKLVFSAHYSKEQIIFGGIYPKIRIPKEQLNVNPSVDSNEGAVEVVIHTPEQGDFGDKQGWFVLYPY